MQTFALAPEAPDQPPRLLSLDLHNGSTAALASPLLSAAPTASWRGIAGGAQHVRARASLAQPRLFARAREHVCTRRAHAPACVFAASVHTARAAMHAKGCTVARGLAWQEQGSS